MLPCIVLDLMYLWLQYQPENDHFEITQEVCVVLDNVQEVEFKLEVSYTILLLYALNLFIYKMLHY